MSAWQPDALLQGFEALELEFAPDYDGAVSATLVRLPAGEAPRGAVLYVHGFVDYFFQRHMAERFGRRQAHERRHHGSVVVVWKAQLQRLEALQEPVRLPAAHGARVPSERVP